MADTTKTTDGEARYRVTFEATWSVATHPTNFPANPHFSGLVGATHDETTRIWERGEVASDGIELMAENGGKSQLLAEIAALIAAGTAYELLSMAAACPLLRRASAWSSPLSRHTPT